jgi:hypothetical protein
MEYFSFNYGDGSNCVCISVYLRIFEGYILATPPRHTVGDGSDY